MGIIKNQWLPTDLLGKVGFLILTFFVMIALLAPVITQYKPNQIIRSSDGRILANMRPSKNHFLGTTPLGQDIFSQLVWGARSALCIGFAGGALVTGIGTAVGLLSGYFGGWWDQLLMAMTDIFYGIPFLPAIILLNAYIGGGIIIIVLAVGLLLWRDVARPIRSQVLQIREQEYIKVAIASGCSAIRILLRHVLPSVFPLVALYTSIAMGWTILTEASVNFLGLGPSGTISWGYMLYEAFRSQAMARGMWHWFLPPGFCICLLVFAAFSIGRGYEKMLVRTLK